MAKQAVKKPKAKKTSANAPPKPSPVKATRGKGRPHADGPKVGREGVVAAAREMLKSTSPSQMTRNDLARAASIDPALIRYYFGDQNGLMTEVLLQITAEAQERRELARRGAGTSSLATSEKIAARIDRLREMLSENPHVHEMLLDRVVYGKGATEEQIKLLRNLWIDASGAELNDIIAEGVEKGELRPINAHFLYIALAGMTEFAVNAFPLFELLEGEPQDRDATLKAYTDFLVDIVLNGALTR